MKKKILNLCLASVPAVFSLILTELKLQGAISWSWWWVTFPLWFPVVCCVIAAAVMTALVIKMTADDMKGEPKRKETT